MTYPASRSRVYTAPRAIAQPATLPPRSSLSTAQALIALTSGAIAGIAFLVALWPR